MSEAGELGALIDLLLQEEHADATGQRQNPDEDGLETILREISQAILPSHLAFQNAAGHSLVVLASNRRLCTVVDLSQPDQLAPLSLGTPLDTEPTALAAISAVLRAFAASDGAVSVRSDLQAVADPGAGKGIPVSVLREITTEIAPPAPRDTTEAIADFLAPVMDHATHWVMLENGELAGHSDDAPDPALMRAVEALTDLNHPGVEGSDPRLLVQGTAGHDPHTTVLAWSNEWMFGARDVRRASLDLIEAWRRLGL